MKSNKKDWIEDIKLRPQIVEKTIKKQAITKRDRLIRIRFEEIKILEGNNQAYQDLIYINNKKINKLKKEIKELRG